MSWSTESHEKWGFISACTSVQSDQSSFSLERHVGFMGTNWAFIEGSDQSVLLRVVQLANRRKVRVEVQQNTDADSPSICVAVHADLRISGGHAMF